MDPIFPSAESAALEGRVLPGGLRVLERLGSSGLLYRAQYAAGPPVVLTLLHAPPRPRDLSAAVLPPPSLVNQLRRACEIRHPNVARLVEVGETSDGLNFAVGEVLEGDLLSDVLDARGALPLPEAADVCLQAAAGLQAAHRVGIAHGDLSPRTILVAQSEGDRPLVKLIRFKLDWDPEVDRGTRGEADDRYASPERLAGNAPDEVGDVFSLGAVLQHLLTGAPPRGRLGRAPIPKAVRRVLGRALARSPDRRYRTVAAFADALEDAVKVGDEPRSALSRHRRLAGVAGASVLAAAIWLGWSRLGAVGDGARAVRETGTRVREAVAPARTPVAAPDTARVAPQTRTASRPGRPPVERREPRALSPPAPKATVKPVPSGATAADPIETGAIPDSNRIAAGANGSPGEADPSDSSPGVALSPFRRAHPWAAEPTGQFYFPSSCPLALRSTELLYFASEAEARATGRSRSTAPGCS